MSKSSMTVEQHLSYAGISTFLRAPHTRDLAGVDIAVMGNPFDCGTSARAGARHGPRALREQSIQVAGGYPVVYPWEYDLKERNNIIDYGDVVGDRIGMGATEAMIAAQYGAAKDIFAADSSLLVLGGDHTGPYGPMRAAAEKYGKISIVHFDAHQDAVPLEDGNVNHGTFAWDLVQEGVIDDARSAQLYIRTRADEVSAQNYHILFANEALALGADEVASQVREVVGDNPVYVTFDVDGIDPSCTPGTGTPVWGGPSVLEARRVLWGLKGLNVIAGDVVELAPMLDSPNQMTAIAGATIALDIMYLMAEARQSR